MAEDEGIRRGRYSTADLTAGNAHASWSERGWPSVAALFKSTPIGPFSTTADDFGIGDVVISYTEGSARVLERTPERIAADGIDVLGIGLLLDGGMAGIAASREFQLGGGEILLFDLSQPITMTMSDSRSIQIAIPRPLAEAKVGSVAALHGLVVAAPASAPFRDYLFKLRETLEAGGDADIAQLVAILARAIGPVR